MARELREQAVNEFFHVMNRAGGRRLMFESSEHYALFLTLLAEIHEDYAIEIHAYCLMSNHFHLLVRPSDANLSDALRCLTSRYVKKTNKLKMIDGPLVRGRFKSKLVLTDEYLLQLIRYIHLNPVKANLVKKPGDYQWSSYGAFLEAKNPPSWLSTKFLLGYFGEKSDVAQKNFRLFVEDQESEDNQHGEAIPNYQSNAAIIRTRECALDLSIDQIVRVAQESFHMDIKSVQSQRDRKSNPMRDVVIYLVKKHCRATLTQIGENFGIKRTAVSDAIRRARKEIESNHELKRQCEQLSRAF
jgi:REP element-mobilizing transposase RayT